MKALRFQTVTQMLGGVDAHLFDEMCITQSEWAAVRASNSVLDVRTTVQSDYI